MGRMSRRARSLLGLAAAFLAADLGGAWYYSLYPWEFAEDAARVVGSAAFSAVYASDRVEQRARVANFYVGDSAEAALDWSSIPGLAVLDSSSAAAALPEVPFVYESPDAAALARLREQYDLPAVTRGASTEYEAQIALGRWVGTRFIHREKRLPHTFDPIDLLQRAARGNGYNCEVAARLTVHAATSLGWPARLATASRRGVHWDHAVAELWSNQYRKWYVLDTDYNWVFEADGRPLSAFELCHDGPALKAAGRLRKVPFAPQKPGVDRRVDQMPYFAYVHVDMRNDWLSRQLHRGSPAGGDLATIWTARSGVHTPPTLKQRVDVPEQFEWPVNVVRVTPRHAETLSGGRLGLDLALHAYAPYFRAFELSLDGSPWHRLEGSTTHVELATGQHVVRARVVTYGDHTGPGYDLDLAYRPPRTAESTGSSTLAESSAPMARRAATADSAAAR
jgi:Transglutaminase-like superfamily